MRDPFEDLDRRSARLRLAAAAAAYLSLLVVQERVGLAREGLAEGAGWLCAALLVGMPPFARAVARSRGDASPRLRLAPQLLHLLPLFLLSPQRPGVAAFALVVLLQGILLGYARGPRVAPWCLAAGPAQLLVGMVVAPAATWLLLLPLVLLTSLAGLLAAERRLVEDVAQRAMSVGGHLGSPPRGVPRGAGWAMGPGVVGLTVLVLLGLLPLLGLLSLLPRPHLGLRDPATPWTPSAEPGSGEPSGATDARTALDGIFRSDVSLGGRNTTVLGEDVMEVCTYPDGPAAPARAVGLVYMRGVLLDTFYPGGLRYGGRSPLVPLRDGDDGRTDGWTQLANPSPGADPLLVEVAQQPILLGGGTRGVLFGPERTVGIEAPAVLHATDGLLELTTPRTLDRDTWLGYRLVVEERRAERLDLARARFAEARPGDVQLPPASPALRTFAALAEELTRNARSDAAQVEAIVEHFRRGFTYSLDARTPPGIEGLARFLEARRGYCTYFATAATLLLRTRGIPARVATGFLARDWSEEEGCYLVTTTNAHAWVEVRFEGLGWVTFEPTPADERAAALASAARDPAAGLGPWMAELFHDLRRWLESGDEGWLSTLGSTLADLPAALLRTLRRHPLAALLLGAAIVGALLLRLRRGGGWSRTDGEPAPPPAPARTGPTDSLHRRLLRALARLGFRPRPPQTPREFALEVHRRGGPAFAPLLPLTDSLYRARYGGLEIEAAEWKVAQAFVRDLEAWDAAAEGPLSGAKRPENAPSPEPGPPGPRPMP